MAQLSQIQLFDTVYDITDSSAQQKLSTLEGSVNDLSTEVDQKIAQVKSEILGDDLEETFNTLKAVQDWADEHGTEYANLVEEVGKKANSDDVTQEIEDAVEDMATQTWTKSSFSVEGSTLIIKFD